MSFRAAKTKEIVIRLVDYKYTNKHVTGSKFGSKLKKFIEQSSRGLIKVTIKHCTIVVGVAYNKGRVYQLYSQIKSKTKTFPRDADYYVHFANPAVSRASGRHCVTWTSWTNTLHETMHLFGLHHANSKLGTSGLRRSHDPYDCVTSFSPYMVPNSPHLLQLGWFKDAELDTLEFNKIYKLHLLRNFSSKDLKILYHQVPAETEGLFKRFYISLVDNPAKGQLFLAIHTLWGSTSSVLVGNYKVTKGKDYIDKASGLEFTITDSADKRIDIVFKCCNGVSIEEDLSVEPLCGCFDPDCDCIICEFEPDEKLGLPIEDIEDIEDL